MTVRSGRKLSALPPVPGRARIGLLGGSFNPAHAGHVHLTREALRTLGLDRVWWLVSPQNPLKAARDMAGFAQRLDGAAEIVRAAGLSGRVAASDLEARLGVAHTARTLLRLRRRYPHLAFVWLMGADNLAQIGRWWRWTAIFKTVRVAVFDRSPYSYEALAGRAAVRFSGARIPAKSLWRRNPPAWSYVAMRRHPASASAIRAANPRKP